VQLPGLDTPIELQSSVEMKKQIARADGELNESHATRLSLWH
jgi:hypothetical protein